MRQFLSLGRVILIFIILSMFVIRGMMEESMTSSPTTSMQKLVDLYAQFGFVCPECIIAQLMLETGYMQSTLSKTGNNLFGFKPCTKCQVSDDGVHMKFDTKVASLKHMKKYQDKRLRDYEKTHGFKVTTRKQYLDMLNCMSIPKWGDKCFRYAEDPAYTEKLEYLINAKILP